MSDVKCRWCLKVPNSWSQWEQQALKTDEYHRLCTPCANRRLRNPWNALLPMRKIEADA